MGDGSENCTNKRSEGPLEKRLARAVVSGVALAIVAIATPLDAASPRAPAGKSNVPVEARSEAPPGLASAGTAASEKSARQPRMRQRGGSSPRDPRPPAAVTRPRPGVVGEVEGGKGALRAAPRAATSAAPSAERAPAKPPCARGAVLFERGFGGDSETVVLTRCDGRPNSAAIEQLSILVRPMNVARPSALASRIRRAAHREWLPGVKRIHQGLVTRLQGVVDRFHAQKITLVSGYRPTSLGSFHQSARALDVHVEGVSNEALVDFCRSLPDTGCGYYPNSSFVHIDVRPAGTGHVYWIDASGPGESARYVASWPPKDSAAATSRMAPPDKAAPFDEQTHAGAARPPLGGTDTKIDARTTAPWWGGESPESAFAP
jgi:hypothetical protein